MWGSGPPRTIGHPLSTQGAYSSVQSTSPPRGPRSDLWVVEVTTSAWSTGSRSPTSTLPATSPAKWAMSTMKAAPTSWGDLGQDGEIGVPGVGRVPRHEDQGTELPDLSGNGAV